MLPTDTSDNPLLPIADLHDDRVDEQIRETRSNCRLCHGHLRDRHFAVDGLVLLTPEMLRHLDLERRPQHRLSQPGEQAAKPNEADVLLEQLLGDRYGGVRARA